MDRTHILGIGSRITAPQPREVETTPEVITLAERERRRATTPAPDGISDPPDSSLQHSDD